MSTKKEFHKSAVGWSVRVSKGWQLLWFSCLFCTIVTTAKCVSNKNRNSCDDVINFKFYSSSNDASTAAVEFWSCFFLFNSTHVAHNKFISFFIILKVIHYHVRVSHCKWCNQFSLQSWISSAYVSAI